MQVAFHISDSQLENTEWDAYDRIDTTNITVIGENGLRVTRNIHKQMHVSIYLRKAKRRLCLPELSINERKVFLYGESNLTDEEIENLIKEVANLQEQLKEIGNLP